MWLYNQSSDRLRIGTELDNRELMGSKAQEGCATTGSHIGAGHRMPPPRRSAEEDPAWAIGNSPAELRADS